jgi:hypothetical protein
VSGVHKNPTISFRISDYERREIEARIKASGMMKKTFFTRCCIYGRICVVGKKETVYMLVQTLEKMQADIHKMYDEIIETGWIKEKESPVDGEAYTDIEELQHDYLATEPVNVIYQTAEDGLADTVKPRLEAANADCSRIYKINISDGKLTTVGERFAVGILARNSCHILGAGAPAKTKKW